MEGNLKLGKNVKVANHGRFHAEDRLRKTNSVAIAYGVGRIQGGGKEK